MLAPYAIALDRHSNGVQEILFAYRLGQEFDGASFHGFDRHGNVGVARDKNDGNLDLLLGDFGLKIKPTQAGESNIQNEATHLIGKLVLEKNRCRTEGFTPQSDGLEEAPQSLADIHIVIHDVN